MNNNLEGKIVAVVGASSGIGEGIARAVAEYSPRAIVLAARREDKLKELAREFQTETLVIPTDVTSEESIKDMIEKTIERYNKLDILINSAGVIQAQTPIENLDSSTIRQIIEANLTQNLIVGKYLSEYFKKAGRGIYIVISSQAGQETFSGETAYSASKAGVNHFIRTLSAEWKETKLPLYAFAIAPGFINTEEAKKQFPEFKEQIEKATSPLEFGRIVAKYMLNPKSYNEAVQKIDTLKL